MPRNSTKRQRLPSQAGKAAAIARTKKQLLEIAGLRAAHGFCAFKDKWPSYEVGVDLRSLELVDWWCVVDVQPKLPLVSSALASNPTFVRFPCVRGESV